jgi:hypothetical protein
MKSKGGAATLLHRRPGGGALLTSVQMFPTLERADL